MPGIINDLTVAGTLFFRASARKLLSKNDPEPDLVLIEWLIKNTPTPNPVNAGPDRGEKKSIFK